MKMLLCDQQPPRGGSYSEVVTQLKYTHIQKIEKMIKLPEKPYSYNDYLKSPPETTSKKNDKNHALNPQIHCRKIHFHCISLNFHSFQLRIHCRSINFHCFRQKSSNNSYFSYSATRNRQFRHIAKIPLPHRYRPDSCNTL